MKAICEKCEWHTIRKGSKTRLDWSNMQNVTEHNVDVDSCIHPILDKLDNFDPITGKQLYHVTICTDRNPKGDCEHFQKRRSTLCMIYDAILGKKWIDIYNRATNQ